ncbi:MAG: class I SAM-dependent methyltransferase [Candidatus Marinimicrobia bacterium]|nr:class I SAM-dependent methyltransferase [Candidatus Neomarinimicrobiota bacterium]
MTATLTYDAIAQAEREKYLAVWQIPAYREKCHGLDLWRNHRDLFPEAPATALDIGCGLGLLYRHLLGEGIDAWGVDFAPNCLDPFVRRVLGYRFIEACLWDLDLGRHFDLGICADVMEHIPEQKVPQTLARVGNHCEEIIFKIANYPSDSLGHRLHVTRRDSAWWELLIRSQGGNVELLSVPSLDAREVYYYRWRPEG